VLVDVERCALGIGRLVFAGMVHLGFRTTYGNIQAFQKGFVQRWID